MLGTLRPAVSGATSEDVKQGGEKRFLEIGQKVGPTLYINVQHITHMEVHNYTAQPRDKIGKDANAKVEVYFVGGSRVTLSGISAELFMRYLQRKGDL
jgi:hypothetical protein